MEVTDLQIDSNRTDKRSLEVSIAIKVKLKKPKKNLKAEEEDDVEKVDEVQQDRICEDSGIVQYRKSSQEYESGFSEGAADDLRSFGSSSYGTDLPLDQDAGDNGRNDQSKAEETDTESVDSAKLSSISSDLGSIGGEDELDDYPEVGVTTIRLQDIPVSKVTTSEFLLGDEYKAKKRVSLQSSCNSDFDDRDDPISEPIIVFKEAPSSKPNDNNCSNSTNTDICSLALPRGTWNDVRVPRVSKLHDVIGDDMARMTGLRGVLFDNLPLSPSKTSSDTVKRDDFVTVPQNDNYSAIETIKIEECENGGTVNMGAIDAMMKQQVDWIVKAKKDEARVAVQGPMVVSDIQSHCGPDTDNRNSCMLSLPGPEICTLEEVRKKRKFSECSDVVDEDCILIDYDEINDNNNIADNSNNISNTRINKTNNNFNDKDNKINNNKNLNNNKNNHNNESNLGNNNSSSNSLSNNNNRSNEQSMSKDNPKNENDKNFENMENEQSSNNDSDRVLQMDNFIEIPVARPVTDLIDLYNKSSTTGNSNNNNVVKKNPQQNCLLNLQFIAPAEVKRNNITAVTISQNSKNNNSSTSLDSNEAAVSQMVNGGHIPTCSTEEIKEGNRGRMILQTNNHPLLMGDSNGYFSDYTECAHYDVTNDIATEGSDWTTGAEEDEKSGWDSKLPFKRCNSVHDLRREDIDIWSALTAEDRTTDTKDPPSTSKASQGFSSKEGDSGSVGSSSRRIRRRRNRKRRSKSLICFDRLTKEEDEMMMQMRRAGGFELNIKQPGSASNLYDGAKDFVDSGTISWCEGKIGNNGGVDDNRIGESHSSPIRTINTYFNGKTEDKTTFGFDHATEMTTDVVSDTELQQNEEETQVDMQEALDATKLICDLRDDAVEEFVSILKDKIMKMGLTHKNDVSSPQDQPDMDQDAAVVDETSNENSAAMVPSSTPRYHQMSAPYEPICEEKEEEEEDENGEPVEEDEQEGERKEEDEYDQEQENLIKQGSGGHTKAASSSCGEGTQDLEELSVGKQALEFSWDIENDIKPRHILNEFEVVDRTELSSPMLERKSKDNDHSNKLNDLNNSFLTDGGVDCNSDLFKELRHIHNSELSKRIIFDWETSRPPSKEVSKGWKDHCCEVRSLNFDWELESKKEDMKENNIPSAEDLLDEVQKEDIILDEEAKEEEEKMAHEQEEMGEPNKVVSAETLLAECQDKSVKDTKHEPTENDVSTLITLGNTVVAVRTDPNSDELLEVQRSEILEKLYAQNNKFNTNPFPLPLPDSLPNPWWVPLRDEQIDRKSQETVAQRVAEEGRKRNSTAFSNTETNEKEKRRVTNPRCDNEEETTELDVVDDELDDRDSPIIWNDTTDEFSEMECFIEMVTSNNDVGISKNKNGKTSNTSNGQTTPDSDTMRENRNNIINNNINLTRNKTKNGSHPTLVDLFDKTNPKAWLQSKLLYPSWNGGGVDKVSRMLNTSLNSSHNSEDDEEEEEDEEEDEEDELVREVSELSAISEESETQELELYEAEEHEEDDEVDGYDGDDMVACLNEDDIDIDIHSVDELPEDEPHSVASEPSHASLVSDALQSAEPIPKVTDSMPIRLINLSHLEKSVDKEDISYLYINQKSPHNDLGSKGSAPENETFSSVELLKCSPASKNLDDSESIIQPITQYEATVGVDKGTKMAVAVDPSPSKMTVVAVTEEFTVMTDAIGTTMVILENKGSGGTIENSDKEDDGAFPELSNGSEGDLCCVDGVVATAMTTKATTKTTTSITTTIMCQNENFGDSENCNNNNNENSDNDSNQSSKKSNNNNSKNNNNNNNCTNNNNHLRVCRSEDDIPRRLCNTIRDLEINDVDYVHERDIAEEIIDTLDGSCDSNDTTELCNPEIVGAFDCSQQLIEIFDGVQDAVDGVDGCETDLLQQVDEIASVLFGDVIKKTPCYDVGDVDPPDVYRSVSQLMNLLTSLDDFAEITPDEERIISEDDTQTTPQVSPKTTASCTAYPNLLDNPCSDIPSTPPQISPGWPDPPNLSPLPPCDTPIVNNSELVEPLTPSSILTLKTTTDINDFDDFLAMKNSFNAVKLDTLREHALFPNKELNFSWDETKSTIDDNMKIGASKNATDTAATNQTNNIRNSESNCAHTDTISAKKVSSDNSTDCDDVMSCDDVIEGEEEDSEEEVCSDCGEAVDESENETENEEDKIINIFLDLSIEC